MHIVCCTDTNYIMPTGVMLKSLYENNKGEIISHIIIDNSVTKEDKAGLTEITGGMIRFYSADIIECDFPNIGKTNSHVTVASYYRLFLTLLLPESVEKVIYLDGDIIVNGSLTELWNTDLKGCAIGCVKDMDEIPNLQRIKYAKEDGYFNAGVLLINLAYWREKNLLAAFKTCIETQADALIYHDQDVLNFTLHSQKVWLPMKYNVQNGFLFKRRFQLFARQNVTETEIIEAQNHPFIIHYTLSKPWKPYSLSPYKKKFDECRKKTRWKTLHYEGNVKGLLGGGKNMLKLLLKYKTSLLIKALLH